jgi:Cellulase (glycosyl hydrolase family 5)
MNHRVLALALPIVLACGSSTPNPASPSTLDDGGASQDGSSGGGGGGDATVGGDGGTNPPPPPGDGGRLPDGGLSADWLVVKGNKILHGDGTPFKGRGANLHDERSCEACSFAAPDPQGLNRWADQLIDVWHATFIRFLLSSKSAPFNAGELQWKSIVDDPAYYADIQTNVNHMTDKGAYVLVTLFADPTVKTEAAGGDDSEWPGSAGDGNTNLRYTMLAQAFKTNPRVLFGLTNEPHGPAARDAELATRYQSAIDAIRKVENDAGTPHHLIAVQAPEGYARDLTYFLAHPLPGDGIVYEIHPYNTAPEFDKLVTQPAKTLPIIIGEYGPAGTMTDADVKALWPVAQAAGVPHIGWNFHMRCPPNMLTDTTSDGCGLAASTNYAFPRTAWGDELFTYLNTPW